MPFLYGNGLYTPHYIRDIVPPYHLYLHVTLTLDSHKRGVCMSKILHRTAQSLYSEESPTSDKNTLCCFC